MTWMYKDTIMEYDNILQALGVKRGRPQGSPPRIPATRALTMTTTEVNSAFIVRAGVDEWMGGDPCGRPVAVPGRATDRHSAWRRRVATCGRPVAVPDRAI